MHPEQFWGLIVVLAAAYGWLMHWFKREMNDLKNEFKSEIREVREEIKEVKVELKVIDSRLVDLEKRLGIVETVIRLTGYTVIPLQRSNTIEFKKDEGEKS